MAKKIVKIAPSILAADFGHLTDEVRRAECAGADMLHLDIMDGYFVPNISFGPRISSFAVKASKLPSEAHLMVSEPLKWTPAFVEIGCNFITFHGELHDAIAIAKEIKKFGVGVGAAFNPDNKLSILPRLIEKLDLVLIMTVFPGFAGQKFLESGFRNLEYAAEIRDRHKPSVLIAVDGGVCEENAKRLVSTGADILVMGTAFFNSPNPTKLVEKLKAL